MVSQVATLEQKNYEFLHYWIPSLSYLTVYIGSQNAQTYSSSNSLGSLPAHAPFAISYFKFSFSQLCRKQTNYYMDCHLIFLKFRHLGLCYIVLSLVSWSLEVLLYWWQAPHINSCGKWRKETQRNWGFIGSNVWRMCWRTPPRNRGFGGMPAVFHSTFRWTCTFVCLDLPKNAKINLSGHRTQKYSWCVCVCMPAAQLTWLCINCWIHGLVILDEMHLRFLGTRVEPNKDDQSLLDEHGRGRELRYKLLNYSASLQKEHGLWILTYLDLQYPLCYLLLERPQGNFSKS